MGLAAICPKVPDSAVALAPKHHHETAPGQGKVHAAATMRKVVIVSEALLSPIP